MFRKLILFCLSLLLVVPSVATAVEVGDSVLAYWQPGQAYFVGTAVEAKGTGFLIVFEDGDTAVVDKTKVRANDIKVGSVVFARFDDDAYYKGTVAKVTGPALYIHYDDGDKRWVPWSWVAVK